MIFMTDSHGSIHVATYLLEGPIDAWPF